MKMYVSSHVCIVTEESAIFLVYRSSFKLNRFDVYTGFDDFVTMVRMVTATHCARMSIHLTNLFTQLQGTVLGLLVIYRYLKALTRESIYSLKTSILVRVLDDFVDLYRTQRAINYRPDCNFPEAVLDHEIVFKNTIFRNSQTRVTRLRSMVVVFGDPNVTVSIKNNL